MRDRCRLSRLRIQKHTAFPPLKFLDVHELHTGPTRMRQDGAVGHGKPEFVRRFVLSDLFEGTYAAWVYEIVSSKM